MSTPPTTDSNNLAIASLILGILSLTGMGPLTGVPAIITGWLGLKKPEGKGMAIAGIILGGVSTVVTILIVLGIFLFLLLGLAAASQADWHSAPSTQQPQTPDSSFNQQRA